MRLIDADVLMERLGEPCHSFADIIEDMPTIDAKPALHGHWIVIRDKWGYPTGNQCSECGRRVRVDGENFCPRCGLKMDGGADNAQD